MTPVSIVPPAPEMIGSFAHLVGKVSATATAYRRRQVAGWVEWWFLGMDAFVVPQEKNQPHLGGGNSNIFYVQPDTWGR